MADTVTNLKVRFGADTKNFKQDLDSGKAAVDNFAGGASDAFADFAGVFGVNMGAVSAQLSSVTKSLSLLSGGFKGATAASGGLSAAMKILRLALISTGIGALIVAFGALVSYFTQTERGAEAIERVMASVKAVFKVVTDQASALGETIVDAFENPKQTITELWEFIKSQFVNRITAIPRVIEAAWNLVKGIFNGTMGEAAKEYASALTQLGTGLDKTQQGKVLNYFKAVGKEMSSEAKQSYDLQKALQALEDREIALIEVQGKRRQSIEELRLKAKDLELTEEQRRAALAEAINLQRQMTADEISLQKERVRIQEAQLNMGEKMDDDVRALAESKAKLNDIEAEGTAGIRSMSREYNSLSKAIETNANAVQLAAIAKEKAESKGLSALSPIKLTADSKTGQIAETKIPAPEVIPLETDKLEASAAKIQSIYGDMQSAVMDFSSVFQESMSGIAVGFGESLGNMLAGTGNLSDLVAVVGQSLGDMAITVGKIAIATGIGIEGIKIALKSLNPAIAIAGGIALVALGSYVKGALGGAASGGTFSSASTGSYDTGGVSSVSTGSLRSAPMTIYIEGEFKQRGPDLVAVIDKNSQRRKIGT